MEGHVVHPAPGPALPPCSCDPNVRKVGPTYVGNHRPRNISSARWPFTANRQRYLSLCLVFYRSDLAPNDVPTRTYTVYIGSPGDLNTGSGLGGPNSASI